MTSLDIVKTALRIEDVRSGANDLWQNVTDALGLGWNKLKNTNIAGSPTRSAEKAYDYLKPHLAGGLNPGLIGAGLGAVGMGGASLLGGGEENEDPIDKLKRVSRNALQGGLLGGITGVALNAGNNFATTIKHKTPEDFMRGNANNIENSQQAAVAADSHNRILKDTGKQPQTRAEVLHPAVDLGANTRRVLESINPLNKDDVPWAAGTVGGIAGVRNWTRTHGLQAVEKFFPSELKPLPEPKPLATPKRLPAQGRRGGQGPLNPDYPAALAAHEKNTHNSKVRTFSDYVATGVAEANKSNRNIFGNPVLSGKDILRHVINPRTASHFSGSSKFPTVNLPVGHNNFLTEAITGGLGVDPRTRQFTKLQRYADQLQQSRGFRGRSELAGKARHGFAGALAGMGLSALAGKLEESDINRQNPDLIDFWTSTGNSKAYQKALARSSSGLNQDALNKYLEKNPEAAAKLLDSKDVSGWTAAQQKLRDMLGIEGPVPEFGHAVKDIPNLAERAFRAATDAPRSAMVPPWTPYGPRP